MATIRTTCPNCGDVRLKAREVTLRICEDDNSGECLISCPRCQTRFTKETDDRMIVVLTAAGVDVIYWYLPAEIYERPSIDEPLTHDDLIDFHTLLEDDDADVIEQITGPV